MQNSGQNRTKFLNKWTVALLVTSLFAAIVGVKGAHAQECTTYIDAHFTGSCPGIATGSASAGFAGCGMGAITCNTAAVVNCAVTSAVDTAACPVTEAAGGCEFVTYVMHPQNIEGAAGYSCGPGDFHGGELGDGGSAPGPGAPRGDCLAGCADSDPPGDDDWDSGCDNPQNPDFDSAASWSVANGAIADGWARMNAGGQLSQGGITVNNWTAARLVISGTGVVTVTFGSTAYTLTLNHALYYVTPLYAPDAAARTLTVQNSDRTAIDWLCLSEVALECACPEWGAPASTDAGDWTLAGGASVKDGALELPAGATASRDLTVSHHAALRVLSSAGARVSWGAFSAGVQHDEPALRYIELPYVAESTTRLLTVAPYSDTTNVYLLCTSALEDACLNEHGKLHSLDGWEWSGAVVTPTCGAPITLSNNATIEQSLTLPPGDYHAHIASRFVQTGGYSEIYYTMTVDIAGREYVLNQNVDVAAYGEPFPIVEDTIDFTLDGAGGNDYDISLTLSGFNPPNDLQIELYEFCISADVTCASGCPNDGAFEDEFYFPRLWAGDAVWDAYAAVAQDSAVSQTVGSGITLTFSAFTFRASTDVIASLGDQTQTVTIDSNTPRRYTAVFTAVDELQSFALSNDTASAVVVDNVCLAAGTPQPTPTGISAETPTPQPGVGGYCPAPTGVTITLPLTPMITFAITGTQAISDLRARLITMTAGLTYTAQISPETLALPFLYARGLGEQFRLIQYYLVFILMMLVAYTFVTVVVFIRSNATWLIDLLSQIKQMIPFIG